MKTTPFEVLNRLEVAIATHVGALKSLESLTNDNDYPALNNLFATLAVSAESVLTEIDFYRGEWEQDCEAQPASVQPHSPESSTGHCSDDRDEV